MPSDELNAPLGQDKDNQKAARRRAIGLDTEFSEELTNEARTVEELGAWYPPAPQDESLVEAAFPGANPTSWLNPLPTEMIPQAELELVLQESMQDDPEGETRWSLGTEVVAERQEPVVEYSRRARRQAA